MRKSALKCRCKKTTILGFSVICLVLALSACLSVEKKDLDKAEEMSYKTIKAEPDNNTYLDTYAWILFIKKKYTEAKVYMDDAMKKGGDKSEVVVEHCGDVYYMNGLKEDALKYWIKSREMGNKSEVLKKKIEQKKYIAE